MDKINPDALGEQFVECRVPGVYADIPAAAYHRHPAFSQSRSKLLDISPAHLQHETQYPAPSTPELEFGTMFHAAALEPLAFTTDYTVIGECDGTHKNGNACGFRAKVVRNGHAYCNRHDPDPESDDAGPHVVDEIDLHRVRRMVDTLEAHENAAPMLSGFEREVSVLWDCEGVMCKARIDLLKRDIGIAGDLKSVQYGGASVGQFQASIYQYGYHIQAGAYVAALAFAGIKIADFLVIAVEKSGRKASSMPVRGAAMVYRLDDELVQVGKLRFQDLCRRYADCQAVEKWPAYSEDVHDIRFDQWRMDREMATLEE